MSDKQDNLHVYASLNEYCTTYNIPRENLLDILEDQKVLPMIRGKATEYIGAAVLKQVLDPRDWDVQKLNLNPQSGGIYDEDVSVTFRRSGARFKAETKNAVRESFALGTRNNKMPHFRVKCHKSRSNLSRAQTSNDRYIVGEFDILLCNVSNAIFRKGSLERGLPLIERSESLKWLRSYYRVETNEELRRSTYDDWRICLPVNIAMTDGTIPRTPTILMEGDPHWFKLDHLAINMRSLLNGKGR